jgi:hypothetical protein
MHRYVAAAQNAYYKAITQLSKLQKERIAIEEEEIGFVSYPDPEPLNTQTEPRATANPFHHSMTAPSPQMY